MKIIVPCNSRKSYAIAGKIVAEYWEKITGVNIPIITDDQKIPKNEDLIIIGSDAANAFSHKLVRERIIDKFDIVYGDDNYQILSILLKKQNILIIAGGSGRATIYAAYDLFRKQVGVEYFWDGDVIPEDIKKIDIKGLDIREKPHFKYRGLRYFAHRGVHRFQAEHWNFEDWKQELDWVMKKRFNIFMLRTGIDDLFQRAFDLPYPPEDQSDPDASIGKMNDRTTAWPLKYRGELRKKVLKYARERELIHPDDSGTATHWYSHTPSSFFDANPKIEILNQNTKSYTKKTELVWDIHKEESWDAYWQLTKTSISEFGGGTPQMFHTIGMAERTYGESRDENLQLKLYSYRKNQEKIRSEYPTTPLLIASWDLMMYWEDKEVHQLLNELDPENTILFDYTADIASRKTFEDWQLVGKFPWIFGFLHAFSFNTEMCGDYQMFKERLQTAVNDEKCLGMLFWPELSHSDTMFLEFLGHNSWSPSLLEPEDMIEHFCKTRYPAKLANQMQPAWGKAVELAVELKWGHPWENPVKNFDQDSHFRLLQSDNFIEVTPERVDFYQKQMKKEQKLFDGFNEIVLSLADLVPQYYHNEQWRRDIIDLLRQALSLKLRYAFMRHCILMEDWRNNKISKTEIIEQQKKCRNLFHLLATLLAQNDDFSMRASWKRLHLTAKVNPASEIAIKGDAESSYSRCQFYELVEYLYLDEMEKYFEWINRKINNNDKTKWAKPAIFDEYQNVIRKSFYDTPLDDLDIKYDCNEESLRQIVKNFIKGDC